MVVAQDEVEVVVGKALAQARFAQVAAQVGEQVPGERDDLVDAGERVGVAEQGGVVRRGDAVTLF